MNKNIFNDFFLSFIDKCPKLKTNYNIKNSYIMTNNYYYEYKNSSSIIFNDNYFLKNMSFDDFQNFKELRDRLTNKNISFKISNIYALLFNECLNIKLVNNNQNKDDIECYKNIISNILKENLDIILYENQSNILTYLKNRADTKIIREFRKDIRITIELIFLLIVYIFNYYKNIIESNDEHSMLKDKKFKKIIIVKEELYFIFFIQENLYWIKIVVEYLNIILKILKDIKIKLDLNKNFNLNKNSQILCIKNFISLFSLIQKYLSLKINKYYPYITVINKLFNKNNANEIIINNNKNSDTLGIKYDSEMNKDNIILDINEINNVIFVLFECFIYEFSSTNKNLYKCFSYSIKIMNYQNLYGFGIYLCDYLRSDLFIKNENLIQFIYLNNSSSNDLIPYNKYFSILNKYLYQLLNGFHNLIDDKNNNSELNINYNFLKSLSNSINDLLFSFMIFSFHHDTLRDIYTDNEMLLNLIITHCLIETVIKIYFINLNYDENNILFETLNMLIENVNKYKIVLPLKCHFHKENLVHNFLILLDSFLFSYQRTITYEFTNKINSKEITLISNLKNKFYEVLACLVNHYNNINFIYSNHILYLFNNILKNSGFYKFNKNKDSENNLNNIILRFIPNETNTLYYIDYYLNVIENVEDKYNKRNNDIYNINNNKLIGYCLEDNNINKIIKYINVNNVEGYELKIINNKNYLIKNKGKDNFNSDYCDIFIYNKKYTTIEEMYKKEQFKELFLMQDIKFSDKKIYKLIVEKILNTANDNIDVTDNFYYNLNYYDLQFKMEYFEYQNQIKKLLI